MPSVIGPYRSPGDDRRLIVSSRSGKHCPGVDYREASIGRPGITGTSFDGCMSETNESIWLSRKELAERLNVPAKTPAEWATKRTGPRYARFGRHVRYRLSDVVAWENSLLSDADAVLDAR
ncbi:Helix-turn-helix domain [Mycobacteroides abscessus subsp. abscessus]|nr:Helix-turn-helix domain [Mycobacteroides abscessus subsp. abscessus]